MAGRRRFELVPARGGTSRGCVPRARFVNQVHVVGMAQPPARVSPVKAAHEAGLSHWHSNALGIALVLIGAFAILAAVANHRHYVRALPPQDRPAAPMPWLTLLVALGVAVIGLFLAAYLAVS
jgi:uncharacterized membrane protein YidH (DUF202 family)